MRIAVVMGTFPELSTTFILDQITGLLDLGHDVHILARAPHGSQVVHPDVARYRLLERTHYWWSSLDGAVRLVPRTLRLLWQGDRRQRRVLRESVNPVKHGTPALIGRWLSAAAVVMSLPKFDVVLAQFGTNGRVAVQLRDLGVFDAPIATTWLGYDLSRILKAKGSQFYGDLFARGDLMLPLSQHFRARLIENGCPAEKIRIHPLGVNLAHFRFAPRTPPTSGPVRIITVCRLVEKKGIEFALRALALLQQRGIAFEYHIVGSGPLRQRLLALRETLGLDRVTFHGPKTRDEVAALLRESHLFLSPSVTAQDGDEEGVPTAIKEAMAAGLPVISTRHAAIPELVQDGVSGLLVPERDVEQLAEKLSFIIRTPERWPALAQAARREVERSCDLQRLNVQLAQMLTELATSPQP